ncbi:MAG: helix-turn-helix domain-containing protein [Candidatus Omnitrophota bacterium]|nr:helix-turn-helix domain-containing protein [Candidatus Omnitrophota bacterium]
MNIETAGTRLKKIRQEKGLSLEDIHKKTKIHPNVLRVIEGDSISNLSPIYLKGFIKIYCGYLGLDAKNFIGTSAQPQKPALNAIVGKPIGTRVEDKFSFIKDAAAKLSAIKPSVNLKKIIIFAVIAVIFIFLGINLIKFIFSRPKSRLEKVKISMPVSAPKAVVTPTKINKDLTPEFTLGIFARGKSWISVKVDGKVVFHGVLGRGRSETWKAKEKVELSLGDAGAVELQVNDQRFANLGRHGQSLKNIVINKEGLKISR